MKKGYFKAKDLKEFLRNVADDTDVFIANSVNICGNISELAEAIESTYSFFGISLPCIILYSAQNVTFNED